MASPFSNLQSKLERAIVAYLISKGCGTSNDIVPFEYEITRKSLMTTVNTGIAVPDVQFTGNYRIPVVVSVQASASEEPNATNPAAQRLAFDARVALTGDMLVQTGNGQNLQATATDINAAGRALATTGSAQDQTNNADMGDFTINGWFEAGFGKGEAKDEGCIWEIVLLFTAVGCGANVD
jgi:hypothetical protein